VLVEDACRVERAFTQGAFTHLVSSSLASVSVLHTY